MASTLDWIMQVCQQEDLLPAHKVGAVNSDSPCVSHSNSCSPSKPSLEADVDMDLDSSIEEDGGTAIAMDGKIIAETLSQGPPSRGAPISSRSVDKEAILTDDVGDDASDGNPVLMQTNMEIAENDVVTVAWHSRSFNTKAFRPGPSGYLEANQMMDKFKEQMVTSVLHLSGAILRLWAYDASWEASIRKYVGDCARPRARTKPYTEPVQQSKDRRGSKPLPDEPVHTVHWLVNLRGPNAFHSQSFYAPGAANKAIARFIKLEKEELSVAMVCMNKILKMQANNPHAEAVLEQHLIDGKLIPKKKSMRPTQSAISGVASTIKHEVPPPPDRLPTKARTQLRTVAAMDSCSKPLEPPAKQSKTIASKRARSVAATDADAHPLLIPKPPSPAPPTTTAPKTAAPKSVAPRTGTAKRAAPTTVATKKRPRPQTSPQPDDSRQSISLVPDTVLKHKCAAPALEPAATSTSPAAPSGPGRQPPQTPTPVCMSADSTPDNKRHRPSPLKGQSGGTFYRRYGRCSLRDDDLVHVMWFDDRQTWTNTFYGPAGLDCASQSMDQLERRKCTAAIVGGGRLLRLYAYDASWQAKLMAGLGKRGLLATSEGDVPIATPSKSLQPPTPTKQEVLNALREDLRMVQLHRSPGRCSEPSAPRTPSEVRMPQTPSKATVMQKDEEEAWLVYHDHETGAFQTKTFSSLQQANEGMDALGYSPAMAVGTLNAIIRKHYDSPEWQWQLKDHLRCQQLIK
uniref:Uncharacterized protein n=1 Tax=Eutreptiella gymnastica TaxID=73025 RepID=A0A7S1I1J5_9EUGL|mmetsp:Transcript_121171/g.210682  ORF Transcript_121171/g.210682 Transcript_121171/m.210682 type:complete len:741 (+) Transcript_121171:82-2304(+)